MTGLDTNVLVRYIMQDDAQQAAKANQLVESLTREEPGFVTLVSVVELVWVLLSCYGLSRVQLTQALQALLQASQLRVDQADQVARAVRAFAAGTGELSDCLIERTATHAGCSKTVTFDVAAAKTAGMTLLQ